jgi:hypothetical protein
MSFEVPIERGKVMEFARATQSKNPAYSTAAPVIPPTFLTTAGMVWEPREENVMAQLDIDIRRILHGEEEYVFHGPPPRAGQTLIVTSRLGDQWEKEGKRGGTMKFARMVREYRDESGNLVAEQTTTLVQTSRPPKEG